MEEASGFVPAEGFPAGELGWLSTDDFLSAGALFFAAGGRLTGGSLLVFIPEVLDWLLGCLVLIQWQNIVSIGVAVKRGFHQDLAFSPDFLRAPGPAYRHRRRRSRGRIGFQEGTQLLLCLQVAIDDAQEQAGNHFVITRNFRRDSQFLKQGMGDLLPRLRPYGKEVLIFRLDSRGLRSQA